MPAVLHAVEKSVVPEVSAEDQAVVLAPVFPGAPGTLFFAFSGTTFRIAPGGVREGPGGLGAARGASQGAPGAPFGCVLGTCFPGAKK